MKILQSKIIDELFERTDAKATKYQKKMFLLAIIPTFLLTVYVFSLNLLWSLPLVLLSGLGIAGAYVGFYCILFVGLDCWSLAEMVSPRVLGRYRNFKTFVRIIVDSPTRREVLKVTKLYNDILEKNGFQNYLSTSEFVTNVYDRLDKQDIKIKERDGRISQLENKITELITIFMHEFQKVNNELVTERNEKREVTKKLEEITKELLRTQEELKKLKGE